MTDPPRPPVSADPAGEPPPAGDREEADDRPRAGVPAPPGSFDGRARSFRQEQARRRSARRERVGAFLVVVIIALGVYTIVTARPYSPSSNNGFPTPGPPINVDLGTPTGANQVSCSAGGTAYVERIPWTNSTQPLTTGDINVHVYEVFDGDFVPDTNAVANVTPTNVCAGAPPDPTTWWYAVLATTNGTNLLTYTVTHPWTAVTPGPGNIGIQNGFVLVLVTYTSLSGRGYGFAVVGYAGGSPIRGTVLL